MRVTHQQLYQPLLVGARDSAAKLQDIRSKIASGKEVNTTSDNPLAARRIMRFQEKIKDIDQFLVNIRDGSSLLKVETTFLEDVSQSLLRARELMNEAANGFLTQPERDAIAEEINSIIGRVLDDSNGKNLDDFVFAGKDVRTKPFDGTVVNGEITAVTYKGDRKTTEFQINEGVNFKVKEAGATIFIDSDGGSSTTTLNLGGNLNKSAAVSSEAKNSISLFDSNGKLHTLELSFIKDTDDEYTVTVSSLESGVTFSDAVLESIAFNSITGAFVSHGDDDSDLDGVADLKVDFGLGSQTVNIDLNALSQVSEAVNISLDSKDGKVGGYGIFDLLITFRDTLKNKDGLTEEAQVSKISQLLAPIDQVSDRLFKKISEFGTKINSLDSSESRLEDLKIRFDELRSSDEDADIVELISALTSQETVFQAALASGARVSRFSLLNFI